MILLREYIYNSSVLYDTVHIIGRGNYYTVSYIKQINVVYTLYFFSTKCGQNTVMLVAYVTEFDKSHTQ